MNGLTLKLDRGDAIEVPSCIIASPLSLAEIGAVVCLLCVQEKREYAHLEGLLARMTTSDELGEAYALLSRRGVIKLTRSGPNSVTLVLDLDALFNPLPPAAQGEAPANVEAPHE